MHTMPTTNKVFKQIVTISSRIALRENNRSRRIFYSTSTPLFDAPPPSSDLLTTAAYSKREGTIAGTSSNSNHKTINPIATKHKRRLSSVAVYHHYDDDDDLELNNFLSSVDNNYAPTHNHHHHHHHHQPQPQPQQQQQQQHRFQDVSMDTNTTTNRHRPTKIANGSCCYSINKIPRFPCGSNHHEDELNDLPPPLEEPKYSVHKRVLPAELTAFSSQQGKRYLMEAFVGGTAESYWKLTEHFVNQSDPAFCGVTTLLMCLNAMCIDPNIRWRGGWRFYGSEDVLLDRCCFSAERIRRKGIVLEDFARLGRCHGLTIDLKRPLFEGEGGGDSRSSFGETDTDENDRSDRDGPSSPPQSSSSSFSLDDFRRDIRWILSDTEAQHQPLLVTSFSRAALGQTGDGHFSPIAAYHEETDQVLVLDVARFKYAPYWVGVEDLFRSMREVDSVTQKPRGWFLLSPPKNHECIHDEQGEERRRPIEFVPKLGDPEACPISNIKVHFCKGNQSHVPS